MIELNEKEVNIKVHKFLENFDSCILSSFDGVDPCVSVLPIINVNNSYYSMIGNVAKHYENIKHHKKNQIIFVEDESLADSCFLRKRIVVDVEISFVENNSLILQEFIKKHGKIVNILNKMNFDVIELKFLGGKAIFGAGRAYFLDEFLKFRCYDLGGH